MRIPKHIGVIPDGNRRWAMTRRLAKEEGYENGLTPGLSLYRLCRDNGVQEISYYGFTTDNTKRAKSQTKAFSEACVEAARLLVEEDASLLVTGNTCSPLFPQELFSFTQSRRHGSNGIKVNLLINYSWQWDLSGIAESTDDNGVHARLRSNNVSRIDLIMRWGGRRRLSGFLPVQSVYSDFYVIDDYWPDFQSKHFFEALDWFDKQDITLGG